MSHHPDVHRVHRGTDSVHIVQTVSITPVGGAWILPSEPFLLVMPVPGDDGLPGVPSAGLWILLELAALWSASTPYLLSREQPSQCVIVGPVLLTAL